MPVNGLEEEPGSAQTEDAALNGLAVQADGPVNGFQSPPIIRFHLQRLQNAAEFFAETQVIVSKALLEKGDPPGAFFGQKRKIFCHKTLQVFQRLIQIGLQAHIDLFHFLFPGLESGQFGLFFPDIPLIFAILVFQPGFFQSQVTDAGLQGSLLIFPGFQTFLGLGFHGQVLLNLFFGLGDVGCRARDERSRKGKHGRTDHEHDTEHTVLLEKCSIKKNKFTFMSCDP